MQLYLFGYLVLAYAKFIMLIMVQIVNEMNGFFRQGSVLYCNPLS